MGLFHLKFLQSTITLGLLFSSALSFAGDRPPVDTTNCKAIIKALNERQDQGKFQFVKSYQPAMPNDFDGFIAKIDFDKLTTEALVEIYSNGAFPWNPESSGDVGLYSPLEHGIIELEPIALRKGGKFGNLRNAMNKGNRLGWTVTFNKAHANVVQGCAENDRDKEKYGHVWLTPQIQKIYNQAHLDGLSHSVEVWDENGDLIAGTYGPFINGMMSPESMFNHNFRTKEKVPDAGKFAVLSLADYLYAQGYKYMDSQVVNDNTRRNYMAHGMARFEYLELLKQIKKDHFQDHPEAQGQGLSYSPFSKP